MNKVFKQICLTFDKNEQALLRFASQVSQQVKSLEDRIETLSQHINEKNDRIIELEKLVNDLQKAPTAYDETVLLSEGDKQEYYNLKEETNIRQSLTPFISGTLLKNNTWLITITFSSKRFRLTPASADVQRMYIAYKLMQAYQLGLFTCLYGTMERFQSGIVHSHIIVSSYQLDLFRIYLNEEFNHSSKNKYCIDIKPAHVTSAIRYVNKEDEGGKERGQLFYSIGNVKEMLE